MRGKWEVVRRELAFARKYALAPDLGAGIVIQIVVTIAAYYCASLRSNTEVFTIATTLGIAMLAVVIAAISILTAFLTEDYGILLREKYDDLSEIFYPYRLVAFASCVTVAAGVFGLLVWDAAGRAERSILLGLVLGTATWSLFGGFDLVRITAGHGRIKMRLPEIQEAYDQARAEGERDQK